MRTILSILLLVIAGGAYAQTAPQIVVSNERVNVGGEIKFIHNVKGGETLYSLSKAYNVSIDEIVSNNESLKNGLKEGTKIFIPDKLNQKPSEPKTQQQTARKTQQQTTETTVAQKSQEEGFTLSKENIKKYSRKKHTVKWHESLESIAKRYKVDVDAIVTFNSLPTTQVKKKQILYIPNEAFMQMYNTPVYEDTEEEKAEEVKKEDEIILEEVAVEEGMKEIATPKNNEIAISYILPLNLNDSLKLNYNFMDFYAGALVALDNIKERGYKIGVKVVDQTGKSAERLVAETLGSNFIIGPARASDIAEILPLTDKNTVIISPLDQNSEQLLKGNSNFVQVPPAQLTQLQNLVSVLKDKYNGTQNVVLISESAGADAEFVKVTQNLLDSASVKYTTLSYGILEGRGMLGRIKSILKPETENIVLVPSNSEAFVSDVVRNLNLLCTNPIEENNRRITLFGTAKWRNFETIEVDYFHRMNMHLSLPYFVDYNRKEVKEFLMKYRALYGTEPTPFAYQGYDITTHFILHPNSFGKMLQSNYLFTKEDANDGFENKSTINIIYNKDYTISVID